MIIRTTRKRRWEEMEDDYKEKLRKEFEEEKNGYITEIKHLKDTLEIMDDIKAINSQQKEKLRELFEAGIIDQDLHIVDKMD